ncbi:hypothetical protein RHGRI_023285 [Rhododendron griersonianum]|uniref:Uncharacterized protein n=1 Tax=Rhododendron griersonianum TaxID=479676 RepID=A0AAV6J5A8_9ERIC|nr:hypothetical protein RHGRI_023285 [Rhododendron griersonianum]
MSHRKVHSQCTVPFLWEEIPGVPKSNFAHHSSNNLPPPDSSPPSDHYSPKLSAHEMNVIPLPPPCPLQSMHNYKRSSSFRGKLAKQEDPFVAALKECTKGTGRSGRAAAGRSKNTGGGTTYVGLKGRQSRFGFSCMCSDDVSVDNLVRLATVPLLPGGRSPYGGSVNKTRKE